MEGGGGEGVWRCGKREEDVPLVEFMYFVFTRVPGESYRAGDSGLCCCTCVTYFEH